MKGADIMVKLSRKEKKERETLLNEYAKEHIEAREQIEKINDMRFVSDGCRSRAIFCGLTAGLMFVASTLHFAATKIPELVGYEVTKGIKLVDEAPMGIIKAKFVASYVMFWLMTLATSLSVNDKHFEDRKIQSQEDQVLKMIYSKE